MYLFLRQQKCVFHVMKRYENIEFCLFDIFSSSFNRIRTSFSFYFISFCIFLFYQNFLSVFYFPTEIVSTRFAGFYFGQISFLFQSSFVKHERKKKSLVKEKDNKRQFVVSISSVRCKSFERKIPKILLDYKDSKKETTNRKMKGK